MHIQSTVLPPDHPLARRMAASAAAAKEHAQAPAVDAIEVVLPGPFLPALDDASMALLTKSSPVFALFKDSQDGLNALEKGDLATSAEKYASALEEMLDFDGPATKIMGDAVSGQRADAQAPARLVVSALNGIGGLTNATLKSGAGQVAGVGSLVGAFGDALKISGSAYGETVGDLGAGVEGIATVWLALEDGKVSYDEALKMVSTFEPVLTAISTFMTLPAMVQPVAAVVSATAKHARVGLKVTGFDGSRTLVSWDSRIKNQWDPAAAAASFE